MAAEPKDTKKIKRTKADKNATVQKGKTTGKEFLAPLMTSDEVSPLGDMRLSSPSMSVQEEADYPMSGHSKYVSLTSLYVY